MVFVEKIKLVWDLSEVFFLPLKPETILNIEMQMWVIKMYKNRSSWLHDNTKRSLIFIIYICLSMVYNPLLKNKPLINNSYSTLKVLCLFLCYNITSIVMFFYFVKGPISPYCIISTNNPLQRKRTSMVSNNDSPFWNEYFTL